MTIDDMQYAERLLRDVSAVMGGEPRIRTVDLLPALKLPPSSPWRKIYGQGLDAHTLARLLNHFSISPKHMRFGKGWNSKPGRGYAHQPIKSAIAHLDKTSSDLNSVLVQFFENRKAYSATGRFHTPEGYATAVGVMIRGRGKLVKIECDLFRTRFEWTEVFYAELKSRIEKYVIRSNVGRKWWSIGQTDFVFQARAGDADEWKSWLETMLSQRGNYVYRRLWREHVGTDAGTRWNQVTDRT